MSDRNRVDRVEWTERDVENVIINPLNALLVDTDGRTLVTEADWITANIKMIRELGPEPYLRRLLDVLKEGMEPPAAPQNENPRIGIGPAQ